MAAIVKTAQQEQWERAYGVRIAAVVSNKADAKGLVFAREARYCHRRARPQRRLRAARALMRHWPRAIDQYQPALVVLAGFMRILTPGFVEHYAGRLINIHPSLLPAFTGLHTHQRAIDAGCKFAGVTVHQVTAELDVGPILTSRGSRVAG